VQAAIVLSTTQATAEPTVDSPLATPALVAAPAVTAGNALLFPLAAAQPSAAPTPLEPLGAVPIYTYEVVNVYPHDHNAFTQGLVFDGETLYEGTGLNSRSSLRRVDLTTGEVLQQVDLKPEYFGEGIVVWQDQIVQLTWQSQLGFVYDKTTFAPQRTFTYPTEGWGITQDGRRLIMSDGSPTLYFWDPATFKPVDSVDVYDINGPVEELNELEYVNGEVFANIWQTDYIARIDPVSGQVLGWIDLSGLLPADERAGADVLNGIAYKPESDQLYVTGKLWPHLYEIRLKVSQ
jgi:glutamine cyclotransferase